MQVQLVAPDRMVWSGEADIVLARTVDGELGGDQQRIARLVRLGVETFRV